MKRISVITMCLLVSLGAWAETLKGKVIDQDAQPVVGATIECVHYMESDSILLASTVSDAEGNWELNYEYAWQDIKIEATKEGHTSYAFYLDVSEKILWPKFIFRLFNAINYKAGKRSTIYLPVAPNSSWGRFYRLDREEENKVIFERELAPKAYVPYVFFPYQDLHIDISGMDLSDHRNRVNLQRISLCGQINYMASEEDPGSLITWLLDESLSYVKYSEEGAYQNSGFLPPMHAILSWMYTDFFEGNDEDDTWEPVDPELVFHDPEIIVIGAITDQDGKPVRNAVVTVYNNSASYQATTDADGRYQIGLENKDGEYVVSAFADGYTSISEGPIIIPSENSVCDLVLYNALNYQAGKRYTIILPVTPDALAGRYFRLDRVEGGNIIFERESSPQANIPYVFYPNKDFRIDLREMDLSMEAGQTIISVTNEKVGSREAAYFIGSYSYINYSDILERDTPVYFDDDNNGYNYGRHAYHIDAMHATLLWNWHAFDSPFQPTYEAPSFVFHDPEEDISPYRQFIEEGKVWRTVVMGQGDNHNRYEYWFQGDTIVGGQKCKIMNRSELSYDIDPSCPAAVGTTFMGVLYEKDGKVYYAAPDQSDFSLLYDFSAPIGTAFKMRGDVVTIIKKERQQDAVFKGEKTYVQRKSLGLFTCWLEAVGNSSSPINNINNECATGEEDLISCMVGDEVLYYDEEMVHAITGTDNPEVKKKWLDFTHTVKTRPKAPERGVKSEKSDDGLVANSEEETVTGEYSVKALFVNFTTLAGPYAITITDAAGQEVYRKVVQTSNVVALNTDISAYPKGSYTLTVENEEEVYAALLNINDENSLSHTPSPAREGSAGAVYNLSGQRLTVPRRGVNIIDGKKVAIK